MRETSNDHNPDYDERAGFQDGQIDFSRLRAIAARSPEARPGMSDTELDQMVSDIYRPYHDKYLVAPRPFPTARDFAIIAAAAVALYLIRIPFLYFVVLVLAAPAIINSLWRRTAQGRARQRERDRAAIEARIPGLFTVLPG